MAGKRKNDFINWSIFSNPKNLLQIFVGISLAFIAMKGLMIPNLIPDSDITGISNLLHEISHINISIFILVFSLSFIYLRYKKAGKTFAVHTSLAVILLSIGLLFVHFLPFTIVKLLIAIFGGILLSTKSFNSTADDLFREIQSLNPELTEGKWTQVQIFFLEKYHFFTRFCNENRERVSSFIWIN